MSTLSHNSPPIAIHDGLLEVHLLGMVDYGATLALQEQQIYELSGQDNRNGRLILCEHPLLVSMGREASRAQLLLDDEEIRRRELAVQWVGRGGGAYVHGPGQLAIYLQIPLQRLGIGLAQYRTLFELAVLQVLQEMKIPARRMEDATGIWSRNGHLAYFGAAVKSWISSHGMYLNVSIDPRLLEWTQSNGPGANGSGARSATIQSLRLDPVRMANIRELLIRALSHQFGYASAEVSTGHPLLRRQLQRVVLHA